MDKKTITVQAKINAPIEKVWTSWTTPADIVRWNNASEDWQTTRAENDLRVGGQFSYRMEANDGSMGFDFWGVYDEVVFHEKIDYTLGDSRKVRISFSSFGNQTEVIQTFEAENENSMELQCTGWQAILNNFKRFVEEL